MHDAGGGKARDSLALAASIAALNAEVIAWALLAFIMIDGLLTVLVGAAPRILMHFVLDALVVHAGLRALLSNGAVRGLPAIFTAEGTLPWAFMIRAVILSCPGILTLLMIGGLLMPALGPGGALVAGIVAGLGVHAGTFALFGTMLADLAGGGTGDPEAALERGRQHFRPVFMLMLTGPVVAELGFYAVEEMLLATGLPDRALSVEAGHLNPIGLAVDLLFLAMSIAVSLLTAAVLGRAWLRRF